MKQQVFYIHGGSAFSDYVRYLEYLKTRTIRSPYGDRPDLWPQQLRAQLGDAYEVFTPSMPNSDNAHYEEWKIWFERHFEYLHDGVILVGWSQGGLFLLKYLSENRVPFKILHLFLLASPGYPFVDETGEDGGDFFPDPALIPSIENTVGQITLMHSKDDFLVPYNHAMELHKLLPTASLMTFEDKNHFLVPEFPELVALIKGLG